MAGELTFSKSDTYEYSLARIVATTKREAPLVLREQGRGILRQAQLHTPPGHEGVTGQAAKLHGEAKVEADIRKLMFGVKGPSLGLRTDIASIHKAARSASTGRVRVALALTRDTRGRITGRERLEGKIPVSASALNKYVSAKKKLVGFLASGWNVAAAKLGFKPPQWIWRHAGEGSMREVSSDTRIVITATNKVGFASRAINQLDRLLRYAYRAQKDANDRRWQKFIEGQAKKALKS